MERGAPLSVAWLAASIAGGATVGAIVLAAAIGGIGGNLELMARLSLLSAACCIPAALLIGLPLGWVALRRRRSWIAWIPAGVVTGAACGPLIGAILLSVSGYGLPDSNEGLPFFGIVAAIGAGTGIVAGGAARWIAGQRWPLG